MSERSEGEKLTGVVKRYSAKNGFGFISCEDGKEDVFVHQNEIKVNGYRKLDMGQRVTFEFGLREGKPNAFKVTPIGGSPGPGSGPGNQNNQNNQSTSQYRGKCKWFNVAKGFGFIACNEVSEDIFVHIKEIPMMQPLVTGQKVCFDLEERNESKGKTTAVRVVLNGPPPPNLPPNVFAGTVKWFDLKKGFGFIIKDDADDSETDIFVHTRECPGQMPLTPGQEVYFELQKRSDEKGDTAACNVRLAQLMNFPIPTMNNAPAPMTRMNGPGPMQGMPGMPGMPGMQRMNNMMPPPNVPMGNIGNGPPNQNPYQTGSGPSGPMGGPMGGPMMGGPMNAYEYGPPAPYNVPTTMPAYQPQAPVGPYDPHRAQPPIPRMGQQPGGAMKVGKVKWFNPDKKFGFIIPAGETYEVMVGQDVLQGCDTLNEGDIVEFDANEQSPGRWRAVTCRPGRNPTNKRPRPSDGYSQQNYSPYPPSQIPHQPHGKAIRTEYNPYPIPPGQPMYAPYNPEPYG